MRAYTVQKVMRSLRFALFLCVAAAGPLAAQTPPFDTSGNGMLNGTYYFRHVYYLIDTNENSSGVTGDIGNAIALYGNMTFSGNGTYTINGFVTDSGAGIQSDPLSCYLAGTTCAANAGTAVNSTYSISASGFGFLADPVTGDNVLGLVASNGIFSGSSTEDGVSGEFTDLFLAAPLPLRVLIRSWVTLQARIFLSPSIRAGPALWRWRLAATTKAAETARFRNPRT
jgi:hypothetical protein